MDYSLGSDPSLLSLTLNRVNIDPDIRVMVLDAAGRLLYSSNEADAALLGQKPLIPGLDQARSGEKIISTNYSGWRLRKDLIDVLTPVNTDSGQLIGVIRVTYRNPQAYESLSQLRMLIGVVLVIGILLGGIIGSWLAVSISRPIQNVTRAINSLATDPQRVPLLESGPQELREQVRAVNNLVEQLISLEQARRHLLANLVHELGRPLGALRAAIHALSTGASHDPALFSDLVTGMDEETTHLQHLLEDLAHLQDQVLGGLEINLEPLDLSVWLPRVLRPWQEAAAEKRLKLEAAIPETLPQVQADPVRLNQVIGNLVSNAIRYTPPGGVVRCSAGVEADRFWVQVSDTGAGIPIEEQEKIFSPFYRGDQTRRIKQGMGLGLSIARDLVEAHGGKLEVESAPGMGSTFMFWIPRLAA
jgi:signal transduction histidine kinase